MKPNHQPFIRADRLSLRIGSHKLLDNASLEVAAGESVAIVGPNGAGKTTLARCLLGLTRPDTGSVTMDGKAIDQLKHGELARLMAYVPQQLPERISFTCAEFIGMSRYAYGDGYKNMDGHDSDPVQTAMEMTGITHLSEQTLSTMSGGERQRVSIAAALAQQTPVLILDEPSAHLDPKQRDVIHALLAKIATEKKITLIVITHDLNWASCDFDRIVGMRDGQTLVQDSAKAFMQEQTLQQIFDADWLLHPHPHSGHPMVLPHQSPKP
ncbi:MAG: ABC transporter ATP-binding protein [Akkermansiaceae bacterium]